MLNSFNSKTASRTVGISLCQIQYWDERCFIRPSVRAAGGRGTKRLYSFADLVKLKVVKNLSDHGLSLRRIRMCLQHLKGCSPAGVSPVTSLKYLPDGRKLFVLTNDRSKILDALDRQFVFSLAIGNLIRELNGEVQRLEGRVLSSRRVPFMARKRALAFRRKS